MRVVADTHALIWYLADSPELSPRATRALTEAEDTDGILVSTASLIDLWYVVHRTTATLTDVHVNAVTAVLRGDTNVHLVAIDAEVLEHFGATAQLRDPWDRLIVATALAHDVALVTRDRAISAVGGVAVVW
ncbi:MAG TPA: PIN domain-containing protein [Acidimicrobiales bacterium]